MTVENQITHRSNQIKPKARKNIHNVVLEGRFLKMKKLNLGCGLDIKSGLVNLDSASLLLLLN